MLQLNIFDGVFDRRDLDNLLTLLDPATDVYAHLRPWGWHSIITATITGLSLTVWVRPHWAAGCAALTLTGEIRQGMRTQLNSIDAEQVWLYAEAATVTLQPSTER